MQQLHPQVDQVRGALLHLRTGAGEHEVDAVIEIGGKHVGIEVTLAARPTTADARQLEWLRTQLPERFLAGMVLHSGGDTYPLGDRIWAVSIDELVT